MKYLSSFQEYNLRENIKKYRQNLNYTQEKLSKISGISSDYLSEIERDKKN